MKSLKLAIIYGVLIWAIVFAVSFAVFPIHDSNRPLFESVMPVAIAVSVVFFSGLYFRRIDKGFLNEGIKLGLLWLVINIAIDVPLFSTGPMKMTLAEYVSDIGATYLIIPVITIGAGFLLERRT
ncbi:MAG TPA: hypothetical protein VF303_02920 [Candidatus Nanoarchaeia archaeon]